MNNYIIIIIVIIIVISYIWLSIPNTEYYKSDIDGVNYQINSSFKNNTHEEAANKMAQINIFIINFIRYLRKKYIWNECDNEFKNSVVLNILDRYNPDVLKENNPKGINNTSYVLNKGEEIAFCIREKKSGENNFHDIDILQFVVLHELTHVGLNSYGHDKIFWETFHFLLYEAQDAGIYIPKDYSINGENYCGIDVNYNPYFDNDLTIL